MARRDDERAKVHGSPPAAGCRPGAFPHVREQFASIMAAFNASPRRAARRRLAVAGHGRGPTDADARGPIPTRRSDGGYARQSLPEHHPAFATRVPVRALPTVAVSLLLLFVPASLIAAALAEPWLLPSQIEVILTDRWGDTVDALRMLIDPRSDRSLASWFGQSCLFIAAGAAIATRHMRKHRLDDFQGRFRAWGWMGWLFVIAAACHVLPLGDLVAAVGKDATGVELGPRGRGWWMLVVAATWPPVGLWALLPLTERRAALLWLTASLTACLASEGIGEFMGADEPWPLVAAGCLAFTGPLAALGSLLACRSVIREARALVGGPGPCDQHQAPLGMHARPAVEETPQPGAEDEGGLDEDRLDDESMTRGTTALACSARTGHPLPAVAENGDSIAFGSDGDDERAGDAIESEGRRPSKAERRRLRKLARKGRAA